MLGKPEPPTGRDAEVAAVFRPSLVAQRGGAASIAALAASRRRGTTMGSRVVTSRIKEPVYPMFLVLSREAAKVDPFWEGFFNTMSMGRFPKGVIMRDDCLVYRARKKTTTFQLNEEARTNWECIAEFFRTTCDIRSQRDWQLRRESGEAVVELTTAQINKRVKKQHANAIPEFTLLLKERHSLSPAEMSEVDVLLRYYSTSNLFRPGDVVYNSTGAIREIKTLIFNEETRQFSFSAEAKAPRYATKETYQDPISYLLGNPFTKPVERKNGFDDDIRKQLRQLYTRSVASDATLPVAVTSSTGKRIRKKTTAIPRGEVKVTIDEPVTATVMTDDDEDIGESFHRCDDQKSDDDSGA